MRKRDNFFERMANTEFESVLTEVKGQRSEMQIELAIDWVTMLLLPLCTWQLYHDISSFVHFYAIHTYSLFSTYSFHDTPVLSLQSYNHSFSLTADDLSVTLSRLKVKRLYLLNEGACFPQETVCFFAECIQYKSKYVPLLINKALGRLCLEVLLKVLITIQ